MSDSDLIEFEDSIEISTTEDLPNINVALIDDNLDVIESTLFALEDIEIHGHTLKFFNATSGTAGFDLIKDTPEIQLALIDIVMETDDAGLILVEKIRNELKNSSIKLIIRTGQPGHFTEDDIREKYQIDGYLDKASTSLDMLILTFTQALKE